jgi:hypothetical protein
VTSGAEAPSPSVFLVFAFVYLGIFVVAAATVLDIEEPNHRYLAPIYVPLILSVAVIMDRHLLAANKSIGRTWVGAALLVTLYPATYTAKHIREYRANGAGQFSRSTWQGSEVMQYLREHPSPGHVYTNEPYVVYLMARQTLLESPVKRKFRSLDPAGPSRMEAELRAGQSVRLVWFDRSLRTDMVPIQELRQRYRLRELKVLSDGTVYSVLPSVTTSPSKP